MKRFLALCLTVLLIVGLFPATLFSASAQTAGSVDYAVTSATAKPGQIVSLDIYVSSNMFVSGLLLYGIQYDTDVLEFLGFQDYGKPVTKNTAGDDGISDDTINLGYSPSTMPNGRICSALFRIKYNAKEGSYPITFAYAGASVDRVPVNSTYTEGYVNVYHWLRGDFNQDGVVDMLDAVYFIGWVNFKFTGLYPMIYTGNKDFNHDGKIDMQDAVYFIGWVNFEYTGFYPINWDEVDFTLDSDGDGLPDVVEMQIGLNQNNRDTDGDGILDGDEDYDNDGLTNLAEYRKGTNLQKPDTDGDGLLDGEEIYTDPLNADTDNDGLNDGEEISVHWTDPADPDTDGDGAKDGWEVANGYDPCSYNSSFNVHATAKTNDVVTVGVQIANLSGEQAQSLTVTESDDESLKQMDGTVGKAYDFTMKGEFTSAELDFEFDASMNSDPDFDPVIAYVDNSGDATHIYELNTTVTGNVASATVTHFSTYVLINRALFKAKNNFRDVWIGGGDGSFTSLEVVLVIDDSGSMGSNDRDNLRLDAAKDIVTNLSSNVKFGIVWFTSTTNILTGNTLSSDKTYINNFLTTSYFNHSGGTNMYTAINTAFDLFSSGDDVAKIMVVLSDGQSSDTGKHNQTIQDAKDKGVKIFTIGLGSSSSYFDQWLKPLAEQTGGQFKPVNDSSGLWKAFDEIREQIDLVTDTDNDNIVDYYEDNYEELLYADNFAFSKQCPLDKTKWDSDGDGFGDGMEVTMAYYHSTDDTGKETLMVKGIILSDPTDPNSIPHSIPVK